MNAEVTTMAIETVIINQNTSIIPDEVLAYMLGLLPILSDANDFIEKKQKKNLMIKIL
jgi:DNA-directed RNA polymerase alpha subunit